MSFEVEQKFRIDDPAAMERCVAALGGAFAEAIEQVDEYFGHPQRDFGRTDEALRLRRVGDENRVTYKGPKLDAATKTRREIELSYEPGATAAARLSELLQALGFRPVLEVRKLRRIAKIAWSGSTAEIALDEVAGLGNFVELELCSDEAGLPIALQRLGELAQRLGLTDSHNERRSYLEMLLEARSPA